MKVTFIIELAFIVGFSLSMDATQLYGIDIGEDCNRMLANECSYMSMKQIVGYAFVEIS